MSERDYVEKSKAQMRKGTLEYCILLIISEGEIYASEILEKLLAADLLVVEGTLYPLLSRLRKTDIVSYTWKESTQGPPRKYYSLTEKGHKNLEILNQSWNKLSKSIQSLIKHND